MNRIELIRDIAIALAVPLALAGCGTSGDARYECADCDVVLEPVVRLGGPQDGLWGYPGAIARRAEGGFLVQAELEGSAPFEFDARGRLLGRTAIQTAHATLVSSPAGDPALVEREVGGRARIRDLRSGRQIDLPPDVLPYPAIRLADGSWVVRVRAEPGKPTLLALDPFGDVERTFGPRMPQSDPAALGISDALLARYGPGFAEMLAESTTLRALAERPAGGLWAAGLMYAYRVELWSDEGSLERVLEPRAEWFPPSTPAATAGGIGVPHSRIVGLWENADGLVWIAGQTPDPDWDPADHPKAALLDAGEEMYDRMYDVVLEALDPYTGAVVHHRRLPGAMGPPQVIEPGLVALPRRALDGRWEVDLMRVGVRSD